MPAAFTALDLTSLYQARELLLGRGLAVLSAWALLNLVASGYRLARVALFTSPAYRSCLAFDPQASLAQVRCPILLLQGEDDAEVNAVLNLSLLKKVLRNNPKVAETTPAGAYSRFAILPRRGPGPVFSRRTSRHPGLDYEPEITRWANLWRLLSRLCSGTGRGRHKSAWKSNRANRNLNCFQHQVGELRDLFSPRPVAVATWPMSPSRNVLLSNQMLNWPAPAR